VLAEYQAHYNTARPHQGIAQRVPDGEDNGGRLAVADLDRERIYRKPVLGGLINEYSPAASPAKARRSPGPFYFRVGQVADDAVTLVYLEAVGCTHLQKQGILALGPYPSETARCLADAAA
jgi:hypothetical protein